MDLRAPRRAAVFPIRDGEEGIEWQAGERTPLAGSRPRTGRTVWSVVTVVAESPNTIDSRDVWVIAPDRDEATATARANHREALDRDEIRLPDEQIHIARLRIVTANEVEQFT